MSNDYDNLHTYFALRDKTIGRVPCFEAYYDYLMWSNQDAENDVLIREFVEKSRNLPRLKPEGLRGVCYGKFMIHASLHGYVVEKIVDNSNVINLKTRYKWNDNTNANN